MAVGDTIVVTPASIANGAFMTIQPGASVEGVVLSIECGAAAEIYRYVDGTNDIPLDSAPGANAWVFGVGKLPLTNAFYLKVKNTSGAAQYMGAAWRQTK